MPNHLREQTCAPTNSTPEVQERISLFSYAVLWGVLGIIIVLASHTLTKLRPRNANKLRSDTQLADLAQRHVTA